MRRTMWNDKLNGHAVMLCENETLNFYVEPEDERFGCVGPLVTTRVNKYVGGSIIELLAKYEDTGLSPEEINELQYRDIKKLQEQNKTLSKMHDKYFTKCQKLRDENMLLKQLLKNALEEEIGD